VTGLPRSPASRCSRLLRWAPGVLAVGLLIVGLRSLDGATWRSSIQSLPAGLWIAAVLGGLLGHGLRALRLQTEWRAGSIAAGFGPALRIALLHNAWTQLMPMRAGELSYVWLLRRHAAVSWQDAAGSLVWLRLQDAVVLSSLALLTAAGALLLRQATPWGAAAWPGGWIAAVLVAVLLLIVAAGVLAAAAVRSLIRRRQVDGTRLPNVVLAWNRRHGGARGWLLCAAHWLTKLATAAGLLSAVAALPGAVGWVAAVGAELSAVLPLQAPAGLGAYEAGMWAGARWVSSPNPALSWTRFLPHALLVHGLSISVSLAAAAVAAALGRWNAPPSPATAAVVSSASSSAPPPWTPCPP
jgi:Lysylphosphatidylglycerol synthase TM region